MNERAFCKTLIALMLTCLPCVVLIPAIRTGAAAWPFAVALMIGIAINLLYLWLRKHQMLGFFVRPGGFRRLIKFSLLCAPLFFVVSSPFFDASMRHLPFYRDAVRLMEESDVAKADIGPPMKIGWPVEGSCDETPDSGRSTLEIPVSGSRGRGTLRVVATKAEGLWHINQLTLIMSESDVRENLVSGGQINPAARR
jgi:Cytochrome oxidase complex assembly protein 1